MTQKYGGLWRWEEINRIQERLCNRIESAANGVTELEMKGAVEAGRYYV
jgi:hypothetical protein